MGIRTNKVMTELNIGLETIVEFLRSVPGLEPQKELNHNTKLSDAQYDALIKQFPKDRTIKEQADSIFPSLRKRDTPFTLQSENKKMEVKIVGKIDLSSINQSTRPPKKTKEERRAEREAKKKRQSIISETDEIMIDEDNKKNRELEKKKVKVIDSYKTEESATNSSILSPVIISEKKDSTDRHVQKTCVVRLSQLRFEDGYITCRTVNNTFIIQGQSVLYIKKQSL